MVHAAFVQAGCVEVDGSERSPSVRDPRWRHRDAKTVYATGSSRTARNTHSLCAERRLVLAAKRFASRMPHGRTAYNIRRVMGRVVCVERYTHDGLAACSLPCEACRRVLASFDARVVCFGSDGKVMRRRASEITSCFHTLTL